MSNKFRTASYGVGKVEKGRTGNRPGPYPRVDVAGSRPGGNKAPPYNRVFVSNISYEEKWQNLKDVFRDQVGEVTYAEIITDENGTSKGFGIVEFKTKELAVQAADKMNGYSVKDRKIVVKEDFHGDFLAKALRRNGMSMPTNNMTAEPNQPWYGMPPPMPTMAGMPPPMPGHGPASSSTHFDRPPRPKSPDISHKINEITGGAPVGDTIFIANLDYSVTYPKLKEVFSLAGTVRKIDIHLDRDNKSKGMATVSYETPLEALQAISMFNKQLLYERPMVVKMDRNAGQTEKQSLPSGLQGIGPSLNLNKLGRGDSKEDVFSQPRPDTSVRNDMSSELEMITARKKLLESHLGLNLGSVGGASRPQFESGIPGLLKHSASPSSMEFNLGSLGQRTSQSTLGNLGLVQAAALGALSGNGRADHRGNIAPLIQNYRGTASDQAIPGLLSDRERLDMDIARVDSRIRDLDRSLKSAEDRFSTASRSSVASSPGTVFVANLPYTLSRQDLKQRFSVVGNPTFVNIRTGDNGRSKGFGHVQFDSLEEAMMAVRHFNGSVIDGRRIEVKLDEGIKTGRR